jgi:hypothetical protein
MKKEELKQLIREVIEEFGWSADAAAKPAGQEDTSSVVTVWEVYERDGTGCLIYLNETDARNSDFFENGNDIISKANVRLSANEIKILKAGNPIYIS